MARAALERLDVALGAGDLSEVTGAVAELGSAGLAGSAHADFNELSQCVDGYEYERARGIAARLLARVSDAD